MLYNLHFPAFLHSYRHRHRQTIITALHIVQNAMLIWTYIYIFLGYHTQQATLHSLKWKENLCASVHDTCLPKAKEREGWDKQTKTNFARSLPLLLFTSQVCAYFSSYISFRIVRIKIEVHRYKCIRYSAIILIITMRKERQIIMCCCWVSKCEEKSFCPISTHALV